MTSQEDKIIFPERWKEGVVEDNSLLYVRVFKFKLDKKNNYLPNGAAFRNTPEEGRGFTFAVHKAHS